jgi:hypothetical protein
MITNNKKFTKEKVDTADKGDEFARALKKVDKNNNGAIARADNQKPAMSDPEIRNGKKESEVQQARLAAEPTQTENRISKPSGRTLSGTGSITTNDFTTPDGESWSPFVKRGLTYNLLSDVGISVNGKFAKMQGEVQLSKLAIQLGSDVITYAGDGKLMVNGELYDKKTNNANGAIKKTADGYVVTSDTGYNLLLCQNGTNGINLGIAAKDVEDCGKRDGLWGSAFNGKTECAADLDNRLPADDFVIGDLLTFNGKSPLTAEERARWIADARYDNPNKPHNNCSCPQCAPVAIPEPEPECPPEKPPVHKPEAPVHKPETPVHKPEAPVHKPEAPVHKPEPKPPVHKPEPKPPVCPPTPEDVWNDTPVTLKPPVCPPTTGDVWGDPHFTGADGEKYDIMGKGGNVYNIMSDKGVQVNALFADYPTATAAAPATGMKKLGILANNQQIEVRDNGSGNMELLVDGKKIDKLYNEYGILFDPTDPQNPKLIITSVVDGETWAMHVTPDRVGDEIFFNVKHTGFNLGGTKTSGLWGESVGNGDTIGNKDVSWENGQKGGGGIIRNSDGTVLDKKYLEGSTEHEIAMANYIEGSLFSTNSLWSTYDGQ